MSRQLILDIQPKLIVDLFAGGGGMSTAFERAFGRSPDIAINHNDDALSMHRANHPQTRHFIADIFEVCPKSAVQGRPVGWLHLSPDCTHHSQAAGGQPRSTKIRGLSWVGYRWAGQVSPDVISLENVKQILQWGPLVAKRDAATGRVMTLEMVRCPKTGKMVNRIAERGEHVPVGEQFLVPDKKRAGQTWRAFVSAMEHLGYHVEWKTLCAADFGGHTTRDRLFMIARRDGQPICWPEVTHFKKPAKGQKKWKAAAECIDFAIPCPSIFDRARPLADATNRRIAKGIKRYVLDSLKPFIVPITHHGADRMHDIDDPLRTITTAHRGEFALATPVIVSTANTKSTGRGPAAWSAEEPARTITATGGLGVAAATLVQTGYGERDGQAPRAIDIGAPLGTVVGTGKHALASALLVGVGGRAGQTEPQSASAPINTITSKADTAVITAYMMQANGGFNTNPGHGVDEPISAITNSGSQQQLVTALLSSYYSDESNRCRGMNDPAATITTENRLGLVECTLSPGDEAGALRVAAFLMRYYGEGGQWGNIDSPMSTITTKDRLALVTVTISGAPYVIVDIGLRMLQPRELFNGQDFPADYIIDQGHDGRVFSKSAQVRMCGNSVDPVPAAAFLSINAPDMAARRAA